MLLKPSRTFYQIFSFIFLLLSLAGSVFLVKINQDNRNRAADCTCYPEDEDVCQGTWFHPSCNAGFKCQGTKSCPGEEKPTSAACTRDQCDLGSSTCQGEPDNNTGYKCSCVCAQNPVTGNSNVTVWSCGTYDAGSCPPAKSGTGPSGSIICRSGDSSICPDTHSSNANFEQMVGMYANQPSSCSFYDACGISMSPGKSCVGLSRLSNGEPNHGAFVGCYGQQNCFCDLNFSGTVQCYDDVGNDSCGARANTPAPTTRPTNTPTKLPTATPTKPKPTATRKLTSTPTQIPIRSITRIPTATLIPTKIPTKIPSNTPTNTPRPTNTIKPTVTPTGTLKPTNTPTSTPTTIPTNIPTNTPTDTPTMTPTNIPTSTPRPTNTPVVIAIATQSGPSPTRIILPDSGVEFPGQFVTVFGIIVTLVGFLILL